MMTPDDPRHGERRGYLAGCREACCRAAHVRYQKAGRLRREHYGITGYVPVTELRPLMDRWLKLGTSIHAIGLASGVAPTSLQDAYRGVDNRKQRARDRVRRGTLAKVAAITEDDFRDEALFYAELTRCRVWSLLAAGYPLHYICDRVEGVSIGGGWRRQTRVTAGTARGVRELYRGAALDGPSNVTRGKAKSIGYVHPLAWDDPGTLAMPVGWGSGAWRNVRRASGWGKNEPPVDPAVIERRMAGDTSVPLTSSERRALVNHCRAAGWSLREIEVIAGVPKAERYIQREPAA